MASFRLEFDVSVDDIEDAIRARARASRGIWLTRVFALYLALMSFWLLVAWWGSDARGPWLPLLALASLVLGVQMLRGRVGRFFRWLFAYRSHPELFRTRTVLVDEDGVTSAGESGIATTSWDHWVAWVRTHEGLALLTSTTAATAYDLLLRRGLDRTVPGAVATWDDADRWDALEAFVDSRVPRHPGQRAGG